jgi:hypothetical protein
MQIFMTRFQAGEEKLQHAALAGFDRRFKAR